MTEKQLIELFKQQIEQKAEQTVQLRRHFHMYPEISGEEHKTKDKICEFLTEKGIKHTVVDETSVVAEVQGGAPGKTLVFRADTDALPMQELGDLPYKSKIDGKMHSCGHDAHTAIVMTLADIIQSNAQSLSGRYVFCFQKGEERSMGAKEIVEHLKEHYDDIELVAACHQFAPLDKGIMLLPDGEFFAGICSFEIEVTGVGGHGSMPHTAINPLFPACDITKAIAAMPANMLDASDTFVISPCMLHCGDARNIIADKAVVSGTIRYYNLSAIDMLFEKMEKLTKGIAEAYGATVKCTFLKGAKPVVNNPQYAEMGRRIAREMGLHVNDKQKFMGSDNYSEFVFAFPGFYCGLGAGNSQKFALTTQHSSTFMIDEDAMHTTVEFFGRIAAKFGAK